MLLPRRGTGGTAEATDLRPVGVAEPRQRGCRFGANTMPQPRPPRERVVAVGPGTPAGEKAGVVGRRPSAPAFGSLPVPCVFPTFIIRTSATHQKKERIPSAAPKK